MITLILVLIIVAAVAVFSAQNAAPVGVSFLVWRFEASLAVVIILSLLAGLISGMALSSWLRLRRSSRDKRPPEKDRTTPAGSK